MGYSIPPPPLKTVNEGYGYGTPGRSAEKYSSASFAILATS